MKIIGKLMDVALGPKKTIMVDNIIETNDQYNIRYTIYEGVSSTGPSVAFGGSALDAVEKSSRQTLGRKGFVILKESDSKKEHCLDYYVVDFKDIDYPKEVQRLNPDLINEEQLDKLVQKIGESFEIRMKKTVPEQIIHTILKDYSLFDYVYSRLLT